MTLFNSNELRERGSGRAAQFKKSATAVLSETTQGVVDHQVFDVFVSHSIKDAQVILGVAEVFEQKGFRVYVDWIVDAQMNRAAVNASTAAKLRLRMKQSKSLIYVHSVNSSTSNWMPWELGYFDGLNGPIAILPIANSNVEGFKGEEFLGLYPYIDHTVGDVWVNKGNLNRLAIGSLDNDFRNFKEWFHDKARKL
jgi:hypothetical protein